MRSSGRWRNIIGWLIDLAVLAVALGFAIDLMLKDWFNNIRSPVEFMIPCFTIPVVNIIWLQIRLGSRMPSLAFRPRREELALTFISARNYLVPHFKWPMVRALAPTCLAWPLLTISIFAESSVDELRRPYYINPDVPGPLNRWPCAFPYRCL
jgi:hypothetical protein